MYFNGDSGDSPVEIRVFLAQEKPTRSLPSRTWAHASLLVWRIQLLTELWDIPCDAAGIVYGSLDKRVSVSTFQR